MRFVITRRIVKTNSWIRVTDVETKSEIRLKISAKRKNVYSKFSMDLSDDVKNKFLRIAIDLNSIFDYYYDFCNTKKSICETYEEIMLKHPEIKRQ